MPLISIRSSYYVTAKNIQHKTSEGTELYFLIGPDCVSTFGSKGPLSAPAFNFLFPFPAFDKAIENEKRKRPHEASPNKVIKWPLDQKSGP